MQTNKYMVDNVDGSTGWILINKGTDSTAFVDRWGLETRDRAEVCEWCTANNVAFTFEDMTFNSNTTPYLH